MSSPPTSGETPRESGAAPADPNLTWRRALGGLVIGTAGGGLFAVMGAPLAWMLGALVATMAATLLGFRFALPPALRLTMIPALGVMLGSAFTPDLMGQIAGWIGPLLVLIAYLVIASLACSFYLRRIAGTDPVSAYFAGTPGGITEMVLVGEEKGGDVRLISLTHTVRILIVVATVPIYFRYVAGIDVPTMPPGGALVEIPPHEAAILTACGVLGILVGKVLRLPAAFLLGPLLVSIIAHVGGLSKAAPPSELIALAQIVIGTNIGARFSGYDPRRMGGQMLHALAVALIVLALAALTAFAAAPLVQPSGTALLLAFAPGGLAEMGLIALSLGIDTAFVSTMHVLRIALIVLGAPPAFRLFLKARAAGPETSVFQDKLTPGCDAESASQPDPKPAGAHGQVQETGGVHPPAQHPQGEGGGQRQDRHGSDRTGREGA